MPVIWAKQVPGAEQSQPFPGTRTQRVPWQVRVDSPYVTPLEVQLSPKVPQVGWPLYSYEPDPTDTVYGTYRVARDGDDAPVVLDRKIAIVLVEVRQSADPYYFDVVLHYDGVDDPTAQPPEVASETVEYQEYVAQDVNGRPVMNSAFDPYDGGMPRDGFFKRITITRNLPYAAWTQQTSDTFAKTLNRQTLILCNQVGRDGKPARYDPGQVLLKSVSEQRVLRRKGETTELNSYYWRVTAELLIDLGEARQADGVFLPRNHRWVVPDAGFHALVPVNPAAAGDNDPHVRRPARVGFDGPSQPVLLNGQGRPLHKNGAAIVIPFKPFSVRPDQGGLPVAWYSTPQNVGLTVPVERGLLAHRTAGEMEVELVPGSEKSGTATVNPDGSFNFIPTVDFVGWGRFRFRPTDPALAALEQDCFVMIGATPYLLLFDRYRHADWSPDLDSLLAGW